MALLGLFSKRDKNKTSGSSSSTTGKSSAASVADSSETSEYVLPDRNVPSIPNPVYGHGSPEASSSKFHLGFRKRSTPAADVTDGSLLRPPLMPVTSTTRSEADLDSIRPPPDRAGLFGDPRSSLSTRSLPSQADAPQDTKSTPSATNEAPSAPKKQGGLFSWAHRERKKSKAGAPDPPPPSLDADVSMESFALKSFRHVRPESPSPESSPLSGATLVPPAIPRPRGNSVASDTSQRISVAAFREMAARRSAANSPTPGPVLLRPPSRSDSLENAQLRPTSSFQKAPVAVRGSVLALANDSSSSESEDSGESESEESAGSSTMRPKRKRTITQRSTGKATTELGHIRPSVTVPQSSKSALGHGEESSDSPQMRRPPAGGFYRSRSSHSTSALQPNAAAQRASMLAAEQSAPSTPHSTKPPMPLTGASPFWSSNERSCADLARVRPCS